VTEQKRTWTLTLPSRPVRVGEREFFPNGVPSVPLTASYEPHERSEMLTRIHRLEGFGGPCAARTALLDETRALHEIKALFGARLLTADEEHALNERTKAGRVSVIDGRERASVERPVEDESIQTTFLAADGGSSKFPIPAKARRSAGYQEHDNERPTGGPRSLEGAEAAKQEGMDAALNAERVSIWRAAADAWLEHREEGDLFTADDLVEAIGLPEFIGERERVNNVVGAWVNAQSRAKRIVWTKDTRTSQRVVGHGNQQKVWRVREKARDVRRTA
jgi:hypothetical protein